jgi:hypothetical protein
MRKCLLLGVLAWGLARPAAAQKPLVPAPGLPADSLTHRIKFQGVVPVPGVSAAELQARAREWVALTFQDARQVTQLDDAARGVLIVRGYTTTWVDWTLKRPESTAPLAFTCRLDFREGRYRYQVFDLGVPVAPGTPYSSTAPMTSGELYQAAVWPFGGSGTVAASPRQFLYQPDLDSHPKDNDVATNFDIRWPAVSGVIYQTVTRLMGALRQHEGTAPAKW